MNRSALLALLALASFGAQAADTELQPRIGAAAAFGSFKGDKVPSGVLGDKFIDDDSVGFKVYGQYPLNDWFAVEGAYHNTRNFKDKVKAGGSLPAGELKINFDGWSVQGLVYIPTTIEDFLPSSTEEKAKKDGKKKSKTEKKPAVVGPSGHQKP